MFSIFNDNKLHATLWVMLFLLPLRFMESFYNPLDYFKIIVKDLETDEKKHFGLPSSISI